MRKKSLVVALVAGLVLAALTAPGQAEVHYSQQVRLVGDVPVSGSINIPYRNYSGAYYDCDGVACAYEGMKVSTGALKINLDTYRTVESMRKLDYFLLDVNVENTARHGYSTGGWARVTISNYGPSLKAVDNTKTVSAKKPTCHRVSLGLSTPWPWVSASYDLGTVGFCKKGAALALGTKGRTATYSAKNLRQIYHWSSQRAVKVANGKRPRFKIVVTTPADRCTEVMAGTCWKFSNRQVTHTYYIGTSGR